PAGDRPARDADEPAAAAQSAPVRRGRGDDSAGDAGVLSAAEDARRSRRFHGRQDSLGARLRAGSLSAVDGPGHIRPLTDISKAPDRIAGMFDAIAGRYDFLNHLLSAGIDTRWRKRAIASLHLTGRERVIDLCTGTVERASAAVRARPPAARAVGIDFDGAMLRVGRRKLVRQRLDARVALVRGDATRIPAADGSADAITIAFGIRNVEQVAVACAE